MKGALLAALPALAGCALPTGRCAYPELRGNNRGVSPVLIVRDCPERRP